MCVCLCVYLFIYIFIYIFFYIYLYLCVKLTEFLKFIFLHIWNQTGNANVLCPTGALQPHVVTQSVTKTNTGKLTYQKLPKLCFTQWCTSKKKHAHKTCSRSVSDMEEKKNPHGRKKKQKQTFQSSCFHRKELRNFLASSWQVFFPPVLKYETQQRKLFSSHLENGSPEENKCSLADMKRSDSH